MMSPDIPANLPNPNIPGPISPSSMKKITRYVSGHRRPQTVAVVAPSGDHREVRIGPWQEIVFEDEVVPGVRYREWSRSEIGPHYEDGCWIGLSPGSATPVQQVKIGIYRERPILIPHVVQYGLVISPPPENQFYAYRFRHNSPAMELVVPSGGIMSIVAPQSNHPLSTLTMEHESPPWTKDSLGIITRNSKIGQNIPQEFWDVRDELLGGIENNPLIIDVV